MARLVVVLFLVSLGLACQEPPLTPALRADQQNSNAVWALGEVANDTDFVFDPTTQACWVVYGSGYRGSVTQVTCEAARRRMAPSHLKLLEEAETRLGHPIP